MVKKGVMISIDDDLHEKAKAYGNFSELVSDLILKKVQVVVPVQEVPVEMPIEEYTAKQREILQLTREFVEAFRTEILLGIKDNLTGAEPQTRNGIKVKLPQDNKNAATDF